MYHQVTSRPPANFHKYATSAIAFAAQMKWLAAAGYSTITLDTLLDYRQGRASLPSRAVIITFDDGYADCVEHAVPALQAYRFTAIFYLVAGLVGQTSRWLMAERGFELPLIDWSAARALLAAGFQCGAHSMSHPHLDELSVEACHRELLQSRQLLEQQLGHGVRHLAYPYGSYNGEVKRVAAAAGYYTASAARIGLCSPEDDLLALSRVHVMGGDSLGDFAWRLRSARTPRELLRMRAESAYHRVFGTRN